MTCACCYDEIKGTQDLRIYSHADSQILSALCSLFSVLCSLFSALCSLFSVLCSLCICFLFSTCLCVSVHCSLFSTFVIHCLLLVSLADSLSLFLPVSPSLPPFLPLSLHPPAVSFYLSFSDALTLSAQVPKVAGAAERDGVGSEYCSGASSWGRWQGTRRAVVVEW